jgi:hypothetical protein
MATPSRNLMPIQKFAFDRTKAQQSAKHPSVIAKLASVAKAGKPQKARPMPAAPLRTAPGLKPTPRTSTRMGDKLRAAMKAAKVATPDDIQKRCAVLVAIR